MYVGHLDANGVKIDGPLIQHHRAKTGAGSRLRKLFTDVLAADAESYLSHFPMR